MLTNCEKMCHCIFKLDTGYCLGVDAVTTRKSTAFETLYLPFGSDRCAESRGDVIIVDGTDLRMQGVPVDQYH